MKSSKKNSHKTENWVPQSADTEQQTRVAFLRAKLNSCCMCSTRRSFFRVKLDLKYNIKEKDKTREIKKKKYFFFEIGYMAPCTSPLCSGSKVTIGSCLMLADLYSKQLIWAHWWNGHVKLPQNDSSHDEIHPQNQNFCQCRYLRKIEV